MSGRIQRAILAAIAAHPAEAFTVLDLCRLAYPDCPGLTRAQLVAVDRALTSVMLPKKWKVGYVAGQRRRWLYSDPASVSRRVYRMETFDVVYDARETTTLIELAARRVG